jgi:hypothetical protein
MENVVKRLLNVYTDVDSQRQWNRAVMALAKLNHFEVSQTWVALLAAMPKHGKEFDNYAWLMCLKRCSSKHF